MSKIILTVSSSELYSILPYYGYSVESFVSEFGRKLVYDIEELDKFLGFKIRKIGVES